MKEKIPTVGRGLLSRFLGRLKFSQLFLITAGLFFADLVIPDVLPLVDEIFLLMLTVLFGSWQKERGMVDESQEQKPPTKNVTPPHAD